MQRLRGSTETRAVRAWSVWVKATPLAAYAFFILQQSLNNGGRWRCGAPMLSSGALSRGDVVANVLAYAPLGWLGAALVGRKHHSAARRAGAHVGVFLAASGFSLCLEAIQSCQTARMSSTTDWAANSLGAAFGVMAVTLLPRFAPWLEPDRVLKRLDWSRPEIRLQLVTCVLIGLWVAIQCIPWVFAVNLDTVRRHLSHVPQWNTSASGLVTALGLTGGWLACASACRLATPHHAKAGVMLAGAMALSLVTQLFLDSRGALSREQLLVMGIVLGGFVLPRRIDVAALMAPWASRVMRLGAIVVLVGHVLSRTLAHSTGARSSLRAVVQSLLTVIWSCGVVIIASRWARRAGPRVQRTVSLVEGCVRRP